MPALYGFEQSFSNHFHPREPFFDANQFLPVALRDYFVETATGTGAAARLDGRRAKYCVGFFKNLLSSDGHQFKCLQDQIEVEAESSTEATESASRTFEALHGIRDWKMFADAVELLSAERRLARSSECAGDGAFGSTDAQAAKRGKCHGARSRPSSRKRLKFCA